MIIGTISVSNEEKSGLKELLLAGKRVQFFHSSILRSSKFCTNEAQNILQATFFIGNYFEKRLTIGFSTQETKASELGSVAFIDANEITPDILRKSSLFLRGSQTLTIAAAIETAAESHLILDRGSIVYVGKSETQFKRIVLLQMHAIAVKLALQNAERAIFDAVMDASSTSYENLIATYEQILRFKAAFFFKYAVERDRHELTKAWDAIRDHHRLEEHMADLAAKLESIALHLSEAQFRESDLIERKRERATGRRALVIGTLLTFLTGLTALETFKVPADEFLSSLIEKITSSQ